MRAASDSARAIRAPSGQWLEVHGVVVGEPSASSWCSAARASLGQFNMSAS